MSRQHIVTLVNQANIRKGVMLNNKSHTVVTSMTLPFDVVMNGILYTKEQILANYQKLDGTPAPIGHPKNSAGEFISAKSQEGRNLSDVGAWNRFPKIVGNRVQLETWIDEEVASRTAEGRELLDRIERKEPISTSVAVLANVIKEKGHNYTGIADIQDMDHNAILFEEPPAAGIEQGVGLMVNADLAVDVNQSDSDLIKSMYNAIKSVFNGNKLLINEEGKKMEVTKEDLDRLHESVGARFSALEAKIDKLVSGEVKREEKKESEVIANEMKEIKTLLLANQNKELESKRKQVANLLGNEEVANGMNESALDAILAKSGKDHTLLGNSAQQPNTDDFAGYVSAWESK